MVKHKIQIEHASKTMKKVNILNDITMTMEFGKIYGLFGRNGSGKTMLLRLIAGLIHPSSGQVIIDGKILHKEMDFPESIGVLIETPDFWKGYTGKKVLKTLASIKNQISDDEIDNTMRSVGLDPEDGRTVRKYSLGMKQRLGIAQAIMEKPDILLLDEPTNALDKNGVIQMREMMREEAKRGAIVVIASHNEQDLKHCDCYFEIEEGTVRECGKEGINEEFL